MPGVSRMVNSINGIGETLEMIKTTLFAGMIAAGAIFNSGIASAAPASYDPGCETISWHGGLRTICDGPREADGGWTRSRRLWTPEHHVPYRSSCSEYSCTGTGGYTQRETTQEFMKYRVYDDNVLSDEPAWLPEGAYTVQTSTPSTGSFGG